MTETFGEEVKRRRLALTPEVSQADLADLAGVSRNTVSNLERGVNDGFNWRTKHHVSAALEELEAGRRSITHRTIPDLGALSDEQEIRQSIASQLDALADAYPEFLFPETSDSPEVRAVAAMRHAYRTAARIARGANQ